VIPLVFFLLCAGGPVLPAGAAQPAGADELQTIRVTPSDTLASIARKYLKNPAKLDAILRYNALPSADPNAPLPKMALRLPTQSLRTEFQAARIVSAFNRVFYRRKEGESWVTAVKDMEVFRNDTIKTMEEATAVIRFTDDDLMQIGPDSLAIVMPTAQDYHVELKRGGVVSSNKTVRIGSANVSPSSPDTVYTARVSDDDTVVVQVYKGNAAVEAAGKTVQVAAGMAVSAKPGSAPSLPFDIPDLASFKSLMSGFEEKLISLKKAIVKPSAPPKAASSPAARVEGLNPDAASLKVGQPIMGYRVECSKAPDFEVLVVRQFFDVDAPMGPEDFNIPRDRYWCRMAAVDLLGATEKFKEPKSYSLGRVR
jgi:hypothetical protein